MKTLDTNFTKEKNRKIGAQPIWILKCPFASSGTYYLSDNIVQVGGYKTKSWISSWGNIDENISFGSGVPQVGTFSIRALIDQNSTTNIGDILWLAANNIETIDCELYLWFNSIMPVAAYPTDYTADYVKATTELSATYAAYLACNPSLSLIGAWANNAWLSSNTVVTNQRFHIDLGSAKVINRFYYENVHSVGTGNTCGVRSFTLWGSNEASAFAELTYGTDTNWTQLTCSEDTFDIHKASNVTDPKYISVANTTAYRYYAFKFANNWGHSSYMGLRRLVLQNIDPPELMWTGNIVDFRQVSDQEYEIEFADQSVKNNKIIGNLLNSSIYTKIPSRSVGKIAPIIYGTVTKAKPVCISAGGFSRLDEDLDTSETTITVVDGSVFPSSGSFTINVNGEVCTCTSRSGNDLTVTRSSYPETHLRNDPVVEENAIIYLVADHPVKAIDHVYVDGVEILDGVTKYTGQSGDEHATYPGKAIIVLTHGINEKITTMTPDTTTDPSNGWANDANFVDNNDSTYAYCVYDNYTLNGAFTSTQQSQFGKVRRQRADLKFQVNPDGTTANVYLIGVGGTAGLIYSGPLSTFDGWTAYCTGGIFNGPIGIYATGIRDVGGDHDGYLYAYEIRTKEITYYPYNNSGEDAEAVIIGGEVSCDVDGYQDDVSGTYTGTSNALIERPDHIFKHFLYTYLGIATNNFYTDAATSFAADSYTFGIVIDEAKTAKEWLSKMAWQCRCYFRWALGKAYLLYRPDSLSSDKTITAAMIAMNNDGSKTIQVERSPLYEVVNKVRARYNRDYSKSGDEAYSMLYETSDTASITKYGEKENTDLFQWDFINSSAMAADIGNFYLERYKERKKIITMDLFLDNCELEFADVVTVTPLSSVILEVQKVNYYPGSGKDMRNDKITIVGKEY